MRLLFTLLSLVVAVTGQTTPSFCQKYTTVLFTNLTLANQYTLISSVVQRTVLGCSNVVPSIGGNCTNTPAQNVTVIGLLDIMSGNRQFFDGTSTTKANVLTGSQQPNTLAGIPVGTGGSTRFANFTSTSNTAVGNYSGLNVPSATFLIGHLIEFFAMGLGCDLNTTVVVGASSVVNGIARYGGVSDMTTLHKDMIINKTVWTGFANALVGTLLSYGVPQNGSSGYDIDSAILPYAKSFLRASSGDKVICNQPDCDCAPNTNGTNCDVIPQPPVSNTTTSPPAGNGTTSPPTSGGSTTAPPTGGNGTTSPPTTGATTCTIARESTTPNNATCVTNDCGYQCGNTLKIVTIGTATTLTLGPVANCDCPTGTGTLTNPTTMTGDVGGNTPYVARVANNRLTTTITPTGCQYQYKLTSGSCLGLTTPSSATATSVSFITVVMMIVVAVFTL